MQCGVVIMKSLSISIASRKLANSLATVSGVRTTNPRNRILLTIEPPDGCMLPKGV